MSISANRLGIGCAYLTGKLELRDSLRVLATAFECGIRYFDTAPLYGMGTSEDVLGVFARGRRDKIVIATKVGLPRPHFGIVAQLVRMVAGPFRANIRRRRARVTAPPATMKLQKARLDALTLRSSFEDSMRRLRTDYVDALVLHEAALSDLTEETFTVLTELRRKGSFERLGVGTSVQNLRDINLAFPDVFDFYQHSWSVLDRSEGEFKPKDLVLHRSVLYALPMLKQDFQSGRRDVRHYTAVTGKNLRCDGELAKILIGACVAVNSEHRTLFASRQVRRVKEYATGLLNGDYVEAGRALIAEIEMNSRI